MAELKIDKKYIDEAVQSAIEDIKQNFVPLSVIEDIKSEIKTDMSWFCFDEWGNETAEWKKLKAIIDKHISGAKEEVQDADSN